MILVAPSCLRPHNARYITLKGAVTCAVCPESAWLVTFLIGNVSTGVVTWSALRCGASGESGKKVAAAPLSKTAAAAAAAKTDPLVLHNRFPGNGAVAAAPCDHPTLCGEICPQPHAAHVTVA